MNTIEKIEAIRRACIEANPDHVWRIEKELDMEDVPCQLADVLLAIKKAGHECPDWYGNVLDCRTGKRKPKWNLLKPLENQDPKTIDFIHEILKV